MQTSDDKPFLRIAIYKDTLANRRGADMAVLALAEGLRERGHDAVVFERPDLDKRIAESWDAVISTGTNELLDIYNHFSTRSTRSTRLPPSPDPRIPFPIIQQFHTNPKSQFKWKRLARNWRIRRALRKVSAIQVLSEDFVRQVAKYCANVEVIGNWSRFGRVEREERTERVIIYPAVFSKGKNQALLIRAFLDVAEDFPDWRLRLLGRADGRYAERCRLLADGCGQVEFAGFCDDLSAEYARCSFVAFPSLDEGFGLAIADAAAFAKPCLTVRDWIGTAAAEGGIVTRHTARAYAEGLRRLMSDAGLCRRMGGRAREFASQRFSRERILDRWETLLGRVCRG